MLAEAFQDELKKLYYHNQKEPKLPKKLNLLDLYERFVESKFRDWYFVDISKPGNDYKRLFESLKEIHKVLALSTLFYVEDLRKILSNNEIYKINEYKKGVESGKENKGIINNIINGKPSFVHRTFAEYFAALWFAERLCDRKLEKQELEFLSEYIFKEGNEVVRNFFDRILTKDKKVRVNISYILQF